MKILAVDDSSMMRRLIKKLLREMEFKDIESAVNGQDAIEKIEASFDEGKPYNLVISDWFMPVLSGFELLQCIRSHPRYDNLSVLMVTQQSIKDEVESAIEVGVDDYIIKPFTPNVFKLKVQSILSR